MDHVSISHALLTYFLLFDVATTLVFLLWTKRQNKKTGNRRTKYYENLNKRAIWIGQIIALVAIIGYFGWVGMFIREHGIFIT